MREPLCSGKSGTSSDNKKRLIQSVVYRNVRPLFTYQETEDEEIKRNEIYYAELNPVVGSEQGRLTPRPYPAKRYGQ